MDASTPQILVINTLQPLSMISVERLKTILGEPFALREPKYGGDNIFTQMAHVHGDIYKQHYQLSNAGQIALLSAGAENVVSRMQLSQHDWARPIVVLLCPWRNAGIELRHMALLDEMQKLARDPVQHMIFGQALAKNTHPQVWDKAACGLGGPAYEWVEAS